MTTTSKPESEQVVFGQTVEGLIKRAIGTTMTPRLTERLKAVGLDVTAPIAAAYLRSVWQDVLRVCAEELYPNVPIDEAYFRLGCAATEGFQKTLMGKALFAMLGVLGPTRTLGRMKTNFRSASNYLETTLTPVDETTYELWVNETNGNPGYIRGVLYTGLVASGAKSPTVEPLRLEGRACTYRCHWER